MVFAFEVTDFTKIGGAVAAEDLSDPLAAEHVCCNIGVCVLDKFPGARSASPTGFDRWLAVFVFAWSHIGWLRTAWKNM